MFNVGTCFCYCTFFFYLVRRRRKGTHWHQFLTNENGALISFPCCWLGFHELALHTKTGCHASWRMGLLFSAFFFSLRCFIFPTFPTFLMTIRIADRDFLTFESFGARAMIFFFLGSQKNLLPKQHPKTKEQERKREWKRGGNKKKTAAKKARLL